MAERDMATPGEVLDAPAEPIPDAVDSMTAPASDEKLAPAGRRQLHVLLTAAALALGADVASKAVVVAKLADRAPVEVVPKVLDLQLTRNPGAAFGLAGGATILFTLVAAAVVVFIAVAARRLRSRGWAVALGLLLGGALGNLGDRIFRHPGFLRGHVVDWIHLSHWPIFNVADSCIVIGGLVAVLLSVRGSRFDGTSVPEAADHSE
jgi:signal peptidase II